MHIVYYVAASVDGFIGPPDGSLDWLSRFEGGAEDYGYAKFYGSLDSAFLGRKTDEQSLGFGKWRYEGKRCWVFSRQKLDTPPAGVTVTMDSPREVARDMQRERLRRAWLVGGGELAGAFRADGLIREYLISVISATREKSNQASCAPRDCPSRRRRRRWWRRPSPRARAGSRPSRSPRAAPRP